MQIFKKYDTDNNRQLERDQLALLLRDYNGGEEPDVDEVYQRTPSKVACGTLETGGIHHESC